MTADRTVTRKDWRTKEMPEKNGYFVLRWKFSKEELEILKQGVLPEQMEDKWFCYMEDDTLYMHRSWTGNCIYIVKISKDGRNAVIVNQDPEEYTGNEKEAKRLLKGLIKAWLHYGSIRSVFLLFQFLETERFIQRAVTCHISVALFICVMIVGMDDMLMSVTVNKPAVSPESIRPLLVHLVVSFL